MLPYPSLPITYWKPQEDLPRASHPSERVKRHIKADDSQYSALSITGGCQRVKMWAQEMYMATQLSQA